VRRLGGLRDWRGIRAGDGAWAAAAAVGGDGGGTRRWR
jgi:hypothetical protein